MSQDKAKATFAHTFKNDRTTAKIQIFKVDKETGKAVPQGDAKLEGAVYGLYARENIVHPDGKTGVIFKAGDLVATLTTDEKGACSIDNLYLGKYYVKEITPSEGYLLDEEEHDVVCDYEGDLIPQVLRSTAIIMTRLSLQSVRDMRNLRLKQKPKLRQQQKQPHRERGKSLCRQVRRNLL